MQFKFSNTLESLNFSKNFALLKVQCIHYDCHPVTHFRINSGASFSGTFIHFPVCIVNTGMLFQLQNKRKKIRDCIVNKDTHIDTSIHWWLVPMSQSQHCLWVVFHLNSLWQFQQGNNMWVNCRTQDAMHGKVRRNEGLQMSASVT